MDFNCQFYSVVRLLTNCNLFGFTRLKGKKAFALITRASKLLFEFLKRKFVEVNNCQMRNLLYFQAIQHLPFESMPILRGQEVSRMPSLEFVTSHLSLQKMTVWFSVCVNSFTSVDICLRILALCIISQIGKLILFSQSDKISDSLKFEYQRSNETSYYSDFMLRNILPNTRR